MDVITPRDLIDRNRILILDDSEMFRHAAINELFQCRIKSIFPALYWIPATLYRDIKTRRYFDTMTDDSDYWIIMKDPPFESNYQMYRDWLEENNIKYRNGYDILWYIGHEDYGFVFNHKEDAMAFKLRWL